MNVLLETHALSKQFARYAGLWRRAAQPPTAVVQAVDRVNLSLYEGEVFGLLGQSGSGKTTLARLMLRLLEPTSGTVTFEGRNIFEMDEAALTQHLRRKAHMIFQHPDAALNPAFPVHRILDQSLKTHTSLTRPERAEQGLALLDEVGLSPAHRDKYPHELSSGEKRRICIGRALATTPSLLIADEPVSGLDVPLQRRIMDLLLRLSGERGLTLLIIAHDVNLVHAACARLGVMYAGQLVEVGPRDTITPRTCQHPHTRALFDARLSG
jgi:ABC-type glutathione transport system ATPase component